MAFEQRAERTRLRGLVLALCAVLYMGFIHYLSSIPGDPTIEADLPRLLLQWLNSSVQDLLHVPLYAVLAWLWCRALGEMRLGKAVSVSIAVGITLLYAGFDEWYQGSIPGRTASLTDWILDAVGVAAGSWLYVRQLAAQSLTAHRP